jgi:hypothetical protein
LESINLGNNRLSGELPEDLLAWAPQIYLYGNLLSGKVRGPGDAINVFQVV